MSSWSVWILILKLLWGNVFLKNHAKSSVSKNSNGSGYFLNFFNNKIEPGLVLHVLHQRLSRPIPYLSLRGPAQHLHSEREARV